MATETAKKSLYFYLMPLLCLENHLRSQKNRIYLENTENMLVFEENLKTVKQNERRNEKLEADSKRRKKI